MLKLLKLWACTQLGETGFCPMCSSQFARKRSMPFHATVTLTLFSSHALRRSYQVQFYHEKDQFDQAPVEVGLAALESCAAPAALADLRLARFHFNTG